MSQKITIPTSRELGLPFEHRLPSKETIRKMAILLEALEKSEKLLFPFDGSCENVEKIIKHAAGWQALHVMYTLPHHTKLDPLLDICNIQAARNRLKLVIYLLEKILSQVEKPRLLEIAAGSADAVIEAMRSASWPPNTSAQALLIDNDPTAAEHAMQAADRSDQITTFTGEIIFDAATATKMRDFNPNIIEMVGLADYLPDGILLRLLQNFHRLLPEEGVIIIGNVLVNNPEQEFIEKIYRWPEMSYRTIERMEEIITQAGFLRCSSFTESHEIHVITVAYK